MTLKSLTLLLVLTILAPFLLPDVSASVSGRKGAAVGGWWPIKNLSDLEVQGVAQFAITEHNKVANTKLKFQSLFKGETQVVSGINYRLTIEARDGAVSGNYEAIVWVKPWEHSRNLTSFKKRLVM